MAIKLAFGSQIRPFLHLNFYQLGLTCFDRNCKKTKKKHLKKQEENTEQRKKTREKIQNLRSKTIQKLKTSKEKVEIQIARRKY